MASAESEQRQEECRDLPERLFKILHAFQMKCEKLMF